MILDVYSAENLLLLLGGLAYTLAIVALVVPFAMLLSVPAVIFLFSRLRALRWLAKSYIYVFRGVPILALLYLVYYGSSDYRDELLALGLWELISHPFTCVIVTFAVSSSAYQAVILHGAIAAVPKGQLDAARSLGLNRVQAFRKVVLPQSVPLALGPWGNEVVWMIKASSIASLVSVYDLIGVTRMLFARTFDFSVFLLPAIAYVILVQGFRLALRKAERRWCKGSHSSRYLAAGRLPGRI